MTELDVLNQLHAILKKVNEEKSEEIRILYLEEALNYTISVIRAFNDGFVLKDILSGNLFQLFLFFLVNYAKYDEIKYIVQKFREWNQSGLLDGFNDLMELSLSDLSDTEFNKIPDSTLYAKIILKTKQINKYLSNFFVRKELWKLIRRGNQIHALTLAEYYYHKKKYKPAFMLLNLITDIHLQIKKAEILGLMYFYGRGVEKDIIKARVFLEYYVNDIISPNIEVIYALGKIYSSTIGVITAMKFYQNNILDNPHYINNPYYKKIKEDFIENLRLTSLYDEIHLKVKITSNNKQCEFSVKIAAHCDVLVNWNDTSSKQKGGCLSIAGYRSNDMIYVFKYKYKKSGIFEISISFPPGGIESLDFSQYKNQLFFIWFERCNGLKQISLIGQSLEELNLPSSPYLQGLILRNNNLHALDLSKAPRLNYLDCSYNPIENLYGLTKTSIKHICVRGTKLNRNEIQKILRINDGNFCKPLNSNNIIKEDMKLEHYFKLTTWDKVKKFMKKNLSEYYWHYHSQCEKAFKILKEIAMNKNQTPFKQGYLSVYDDYVSDDTIIHDEEFFLEKRPWIISMATKVREWKRREPWMQYEPITAEYFVACCLVNMIFNREEMRNIKFLN